MEYTSESKLSMPITQIRGFKYEFETKVKELLKEFHENTGQYIKAVDIAEGSIDVNTVKAKVVIEL